MSDTARLIGTVALLAGAATMATLGPAWLVYFGAGVGTAALLLLVDEVARRIFESRARP